MSLHALGISVNVHIELIDNSLLKKVAKLYFELKYFEKKWQKNDLFANIVNI